MLSHHSMVFINVTFSLLAHHCMSVYTPLCLSIMLCHHLCIPMLVCLSFCSDKECQEPTQSQETPLHESPEWVCMSGGVRLQQWHILKCQIWGNLKSHDYCETKCVSDTLTMVVWYLEDATYEHLYVGNSDGDNVFSCFRTSEDTKSASQDNLDGKASEKVSFRLNLRKQIILKKGICNILNTCSVIVSNFYFGSWTGFLNFIILLSEVNLWRSLGFCIQKHQNE